MTRSYAKLQKLVRLHTEHMNPSHNFGHILVAAGLINKTIDCPEAYLSACGEQGISTYKAAALEYFKTVNQPVLKPTFTGEYKEDPNKSQPFSEARLALLDTYAEMEEAHDLQTTAGIEAMDFHNACGDR